MSRVLHAEWTKLRTEPVARWLLVATVLSLAGVQVGQVLVVLSAVLVIGGEHATGLLRTTFTAAPRRTVVLAAKAVLISGLALAAGTVALLGRVAGGSTLPAAAGSVPHLVLIGLLALGVGAAIRDPAASAGAVFALLYAVPLVAVVINAPELQRALRRFAPTTAGLAGLAGWSVAALLLGAFLLHRRDP